MLFVCIELLLCYKILKYYNQQNNYFGDMLWFYIVPTLISTGRIEIHMLRIDIVKTLSFDVEFIVLVSCFHCASNMPTSRAIDCGESVD